MPLAKGAVVRALRLAGGWSETLRTVGSARGEDCPQPAELVDAYLGRAQEREGGKSEDGSGGGGGEDVGAGFGFEPRCPVVNGSSTSIGKGKTTVVFWLLPISSKVCR